MSLDQDIINLKTSVASTKLEIYQSIIKQISDSQGKGKLNLDNSTVASLFTEVIKDLESDDQSLVCLLLEHLKPILRHKSSASDSLFSDEQLLDILKSVINLMKISQEERVLLLCFSYLDEFLTEINFVNSDIEIFLNKTAEILCRKVPDPVYVAACNFIFRFLKAHEKDVSHYIHILPKLLFIPLSHSSAEVRSIAEKTVDTFPKVLLYFENAKAANALIKILKETYCKDLLQIMKAKKEDYVLKVWNLIVNALGKTFHANLTVLNPFFQLVEKAFKSSSDDVCKSAFMSWKHLIDNLALDEEVLNTPKRLRFMLKPFKNVSKTSDTVTMAACESWWHLVWSLNHNLSSRFTEVCLPLLEFTIGKSLSSLGEKSTAKTSPPALMKKGCEILLRLLEQPPNTTFGRISSPKKLTSLTFPPLQTPLHIKEIARHFKELLSMIRALIEVFGNHKDMTNQMDCLMKSLLFILSSVVEDDTKESIEVVVAFITLVNEITDSKLCPSSTCLKCIDTLSKFPKSILVSHCFNGGICKPQNILCVNLLKLLFNPYLVENETSNKRYLPAYTRLVQAGISDSVNPLSMTQKLIQMLKSVIASDNCPSDLILELWSGIASSLLATIEKTQEINEGDKQDHDFSCLYAVLLCPFEPMFPFSTSQLHSKPCFQVWSDLFKCFIRNAELVPTTLPNETSEHFCAKLKNCVNEKELKDPQFFENFCHLFHILLESIDFASFSSTSSQGIANILAKQKKPLGNIKSFIDLLCCVLNSYYNFCNFEEEIYQSCTPKAQKRGHVYKAAMPVDILKNLFQNLKFGSIIRSVLEEIVQPISKLFSCGQKKVNSNVVHSKLETLLNVMMSTIEMYCAGPYDSEFLSVLSPLLEAGFSHNRRQIKERCRRFWFASFANVSSNLQYPETLKNVLKKNKLPLISGENVSPLDDMSFSQDLGVIEDSEVIMATTTTTELNDTFVKPFEVLKHKDAISSSSDTLPRSSKTKKTGVKKSVDELPDDEFVKICSPSTTTKRKSIRKKRSFVPALYNDLSLSQDTSTFGGSSDFFESSCEILESKSNLDIKEPCVSSEIKKSPEKKEEIELNPDSDFNDASNKETKESKTDDQIKEETVVIEIISSSENSVTESNVKENVDTKADANEDPSVISKEVLPQDTSLDSKKESSFFIVRPPTPHVKKTARKSLSGRKRVLSETFSLMSPDRTTGKPVIDIIDLSDSDEIIPSSQSSSENENATKKSPRSSESLGSKSPAKKRKGEPPASLPSNEVEECPETPTDLMILPLQNAASEVESRLKTDQESECVIESNPKQEPESIMDESASIMPLKSSENLLSSEEPIAKAEIFSDILKPIDSISLNVAENTPPLLEDVFVVQNALLESETKAFAESKAISSEMKLQGSSEVIKDASKATRSKSARIAARKSLVDHPTKKASKRVPKRKTMFEFSQTDHNAKKPKCSVAVIGENEKSQENGNVKDSEISSEMKKELNSAESSKDEPSGVDSFLDDSLMTDVSKVILDIQDKLASFSGPDSGEVFSQGEIIEPMEISQCIKETCELVGDGEEASQLSSCDSVENNVIQYPMNKENSETLEKTEVNYEKVSCDPDILVNLSEKEPIHKAPGDSSLVNCNEILSVLPLDCKESCDADDDLKMESKVSPDPLIIDKNVSDSISISRDVVASKLLCDISSNLEPCISLKPDNTKQTITTNSVETLINEVPHVSEEAFSQEIPLDPSHKFCFNFVEEESESVEVNPLNNLPCAELKVDEVEVMEAQNSLDSQDLLGKEDEPLKKEEECNLPQVHNSSDIFEFKENIDSSVKSDSNGEESDKFSSSLGRDEEIGVNATQLHSEVMESESIEVTSTQNDSQRDELSFNCTQKDALISLSDCGSSSSEVEETDATEISIHDELQSTHKSEKSENETETKEIHGDVFNPDSLRAQAVASIEKTNVPKRLKKSNVEKSRAGTSRKRKLMYPVRSPINIRERVFVSSVPAKKKVSETPTGSTSTNDPDVTKLKLTLSGSTILQMVENKASADSTGPLVKNVPGPSKINLDELTSINTRANASTALQTRRLKLLEVGCGVENTALDPPSSPIAGSILKKRQSTDSKPSKIRRVTFADPLYEELLFRKEENSLQCSKSLKTVVLKEQNADVSKEKDKGSKSNVTSLLSTEDASAEFENSDSLTDYSNLPVSPLLVNCTESVRVILNDLTSPTWVRALQALLESRHIETIGDLCRLNIHELKALPFGSPKVLNLHRALARYLNRTQAETLDKLKHIDEGCSSGDSKGMNKETDTTNDVNMIETSEREIFESLAGELMSNKIQHLSTQTLVSLSEKCFNEMSKRLQNS